MFCKSKYSLLSSPALYSFPERSANATQQEENKKPINYRGKSVAPIRETFPLLNLPDDAILSISDRLDYQSLIQFKRSCWRIYEMITDNMIVEACIKDGFKKVNPEEMSTDILFYKKYCNNTGTWETIGTFQKNEIEYSTECRELKNIYSYQMDHKNNEYTQTILFSLVDGSVARFIGFGECFCDYQETEFKLKLSYNCYGSMSHEYYGSIKFAPNWDSLIDDLVIDDLKNLVESMKTNNEKILITWLESSFEDENVFRRRLKTVFQATTSRPQAS